MKIGILGFDKTYRPKTLTYKMDVHKTLQFHLGIPYGRTRSLTIPSQTPLRQLRQLKEDKGSRANDI